LTPWWFCLFKHRRKDKVLAGVNLNINIAGGERMVKLSEAKVGQKLKIVSIEGASSAKQRLKEMGLTKGVVLEVVKVAPLGDPIDVLVRGYHLSIRKKEAELVEG
jgi:Fe2+ transport system protein FeoA